MSRPLRYSVLQCVAVCCSVLQCVTVCCSVLQCVAVCYSVLQCVTLSCRSYWCSVAWSVHYDNRFLSNIRHESVLQCVAVPLQWHLCITRLVLVILTPKRGHCNTLQHTASHYITLQYAATHWNTLQHTSSRSSSATAPHPDTLQHIVKHCIRKLRLYIYVG